METLEEAAENNSKKAKSIDGIGGRYLGFVDGAKWQKEHYGLMEIELRHTKRLLASCEQALESRDKQQERMCGEEEIIQLIQFLSMSEEFNEYGSVSKETANYFMRQFKNK